MSLETLQLLSPVVLVTAGLVFLLLERWKPYNAQRAFREGFWVDLLGYGVVQSYLMGLVISALIAFVDGHTGISRWHLVSNWPIPVQVAFFVVWHDLNTYCIHWAQHHSQILWRTHEAHHSTPDVDWLSGIRSHSLEILLYETVSFMPVILLGAAPEVPLYKGMINAVYGMWIHANLDVRMGPFLWLFNGPELHRWHHANDDANAYGKNLGTKLTVWDRLFGTIYRPQGHATDYRPEDPAYPKGYVAQHLYAFRPFPKSARSAAEATSL